ncbi:UDP-N-acetylmuramate--L-alanine ligase [Desulfoluna limicola]|uniref:UDP-N-acetylmuramate--L-alanine ligase n=1 Tax=Desulfoluna limicola TaxID=2810562 RepID=A0ABM7PBD6_9BACT|nr:UDP-N-acetylmuramate--L-alanine ligase [Desulfoluna limicola]BCS94461.1 UDP-N-acetylmuramate--L-alanine ligase [Desulfoluna limicola]
MYQKKYHIHFVGIGGIGMSGIAEILVRLGYTVTGSDLKPSANTRRLEELGCRVSIGHAQEHIEGADVVVTSSAVDRQNPEVVAAKKSGTPIIPRAEMLAELMRLKYSIAVAGAHGKTSTTSITAAILEKGGLDPTVVIGGVLKSKGTNAMHGLGDFIIAEADESDGSFLKFSPSIAIITNIDREHLDHYGNLATIKKAFVQFTERVPFYGLSILCLDNESVQEILPELTGRYTTYGLNTRADYQARGISFEGSRSFFSVYHHDELLGEITLNLPGVHNVSNCLASIAAAREIGIDFPTIKCALETIQGVKRRLEKKGERDGVMVVDDYGHHPTELKTTLLAARESWPEKRIVAVFQPHRHTRTRDLFDEFTRAFYNTDALMLLPIYAAGEAPVEGITSQSLVEAIGNRGHENVTCFETFDEVVDHLEATLEEGDLLLTLGAGDVLKVGEMYLERGDA